MISDVVMFLFIFIQFSDPEGFVYRWIINKIIADIKASSKHKQLFFESISYLTDTIKRIIYKQRYFSIKK